MTKEYVFPMNKLSMPVQDEGLRGNEHERPCEDKTTLQIQDARNVSQWKIWFIMILSSIAAADKAEASNGKNGPTKDKVDKVEINHFHDDQGRPVFDQIIFYDWSQADKRYQVRDWRLLKNQNQVPLKDTGKGTYRALWNDFKNNDALREAEAIIVEETDTAYDPELLDRDLLSEGKRKKLKEIPPPVKTPEGKSPLDYLFRVRGVPVPAVEEHGR